MSECAKIIDRAIFEIEELRLSNDEFIDALKALESEAIKRRMEFEEGEAAND